MELPRHDVEAIHLTKEVGVVKPGWDDRHNQSG
jgi:hypothetical protein